MIHRTPFFLPWLYPSLVWRMPANANELYLTFDDGPIPGPTEFVLEILDKFSIKATFFCIGDNIRKHPEIFAQLVRKGHTIGNHTYNHIKGWSVSVSEYRANVDLFHEQLRTVKYTHNVKLFRPPYGRITRHQIAALQDYTIVMWDVLSVDYNSSLSPEACFKNSVCATRPGSIVVFHDSLKAERNVKYALPRYIAYFLERGFQFKVLTP